MSETKWKVEKIISGGQTGVDRVALEVAKAAGIVTGGVVPRDYMTSNGPDKSLINFGVEQIKTEHSLSLSAQYIVRSQMNVDAAGATLVLKYKASPGTDKTIYYAIKHHWPRTDPDLEALKSCTKVWRPCFVVNFHGGEDQTVANIRKFIDKHCPNTLNIAGHRDDGSPQTRAFLAAMRRVLTRVFE